MIVEPDFLDHWKTREFIRVTNDPAAPLVLFRLWAHCQFRKTSRFPNLSDNALASICRWEKSPQELRAILLELGFIEQKGEIMIVHDWEDTNRILVSAWFNGAKGGRPRKKKTSRLTGRLTDPSSLSSLSSLNNKEGDLKGKPKDQKQVEDFCASICLPRSDGEAMWLHWQEKGMGKVRDWRMTIRKWKSFGYLPSQKMVSKSVKDKPKSAEDVRMEQLFRDTERKIYGQQGRT